MDVLALRGKVSVLLEPDPAKAGQLHASFLGTDRAREPEGAERTPSALEARVAHLAVVVSLFLQLDLPEEVGEGSVQVPKRLLWGALGDLIEPRELGLLLRVELTMEVYRSGRPPDETIGLDLAGKTPVVGEAGGAAVPGKQVLL